MCLQFVSKNTRRAYILFLLCAVPVSAQALIPHCAKFLPARTDALFVPYSLGVKSPTLCALPKLQTQTGGTLSPTNPARHPKAQYSPHLPAAPDRQAYRTLLFFPHGNFDTNQCRAPLCSSARVPAV